jgi:hypothetical protein
MRKAKINSWEVGVRTREASNKKTTNTIKGQNETDLQQIYSGQQKVG